jgi:phytoene dehydrogenase-like protein
VIGPAFDAIVIGGGANGLVAAARLGKEGRRVLLLEAAPTLGGQGRVFEFAPGFSAAPFGIDPGWLPSRIAGALRLDGLDPVTVDAPLTVAAAPGDFLTLSRDPATASESIRRYSKPDAAKWGAFTTLLRNLSGFLEVLYQTQAPDVDIRSLGELVPLLSLGRKFRALGRRDMLEFLRTLPLSVGELLDDWFECVPLKAAVATGGIQDLRQGPRSGGTGFVLLHHLVGTAPGAVRGRMPWRGGPEAFTRAAEAAARRFGVTIRAEAEVGRIRVHDETVTGVGLASGEEIEAASVISTADPARTFLEWIDPVWLDPEFVRSVGNVRHRGCTAFVLFALDALPEVRGLAATEALAGVVSLTPDLASLERAADAAKYGAVPERPHVELTVPTLSAPGLAANGRHVAIARVSYAPYRLKDGASWDDTRRDALAESVTSTIEAVAPGFRSRVLHRAAWTPADLAERFGLREGSSTQGELALDQILFMRPVAGWGRHATPVSGLFLGGCGTHPGPGILGGAGWLAAGRLLERVGRSR